MKIFSHRKLLVATKHHKEKVIAPIFENALAVSCFISDAFDTDTLGTFSGEIVRVDDPLTTLRKKCLLAMERNHCDLVIASEGSFGAHPFVFFAKADDELMMLVDAKNDLEIVARELTMETNFNASVVTNEIELQLFAERAGFPSHGLILRRSEHDCTKIIKGITKAEDLNKHFHDFISKYGSVYVETDMRANFNPTRMKVIEKAAVKLLKAVESLCPNCETPGFIVTKAISGLPCSLCNSPTNSIMSFLYRCKKCDFTKEDIFPLKKIKEDPENCNFCNP